MFAFAGQVAGNFVSGYISQVWQSRKKAMLLFILLSASFVAVYLFAGLQTITMFYVICACLGFAAGIGRFLLPWRPNYSART